jgi:saccharopine dehydrogenase-like NADP-dependent oxidoreductase
MKNITILGAGLIGKAIAIDLCKEYCVTSVDINTEVLGEIKESYSINTLITDLTSPQAIKKVTASADLVIGAVPGFMGFDVLETVINCRKDIVDISFFNEDPFALDELAKEHDVTAVVDCGVAPGMSNIILGYHNEKMSVDRFECYVGGLPVARTLPYEYKAPFSPIDVIAEYTRPARIMENGELIVRPALSEVELLEFEGIGTLEAFNTDGLRTLLKTMPVPNMKEKTMRYPGHARFMNALRDTGFFDENSMEVNGTSVRPIDVTVKLLFPKWKLAKNEEEFTVMRVLIEGKENDKDKKYSYSLFDRFEINSGTSSMARTTGYTCTAVARLVLENQFTTKGICPPEYIGASEGCFERIMKHFEKRNITLQKYFTIPEKHS